jgi:sigma-B regulation protein RsbU (phosphoserine phosphatase)
MKTFLQPWVRRLAERGLFPRSALARITAYLGALYVLLAITHVILGAGGRTSSLGGWLTALGLVVGLLLVILFVRWARRYLLWRLRNRLVVTYLFIGVIPVALLLLMAALAGYFFIGQFATFLATSDLRNELAQVKISNDELAAQIAGELNAGTPPQRIAEIVRKAEHIEGSAPRSVTFWLGGEAFQARSGSDANGAPSRLPNWLENELSAAPHEFSSFLVGEGKLRFFAARQLQVGPADKNEKLVVASSAPLTAAMLSRLAEKLGVITIYTSHHPAEGPATPSLRGHEAGTLLMSGGTLSPGSWWDGEVSLLTFLPARHWPAGNGVTLETLVRSRKSILYARLVATLGERATAPIAFFSAAAVMFTVIELLALWVAVRLTRSMTAAVAQLYSATQRVNRGDFSHRIAVRSDDQLAALENSFNSMTANIERLLAEEQEKQRIENELSIAQEVQNQLFPRQAIELETLDVYGVCRPARTVSGDYYDFLVLGRERLGIPLGDISGKGISAALLMATLHSAVRSLVMLPAQVAAGVPAMAVAGGAASSNSTAAEGPEISPARWLALLNRHLFHSTSPEKYATLFLGVYDGPSRRLFYSNGGHLPPLILAADGGVRRLDCGGMAIGLFDDMRYEEASVALAPGDLFVAYSDGITEPENDFGEFGEQRLIELIRQNSDLPLERVAEEVIAAVKDWIGAAEQPDDITLVLARAR